MLRKNQLKTFSIQRLQQLSQSETNSELLLLIKQIISERNFTLNEKLILTKTQLSKIRKSTKKTINQMNFQVRDILAKKQKIVMDRHSRPKEEDIKNLSLLYQYMERQNDIIDRNNKDIESVLQIQQTNFNKLHLNTFRNSDNANIINIISIASLDTEYQRLTQAVQTQKFNLATKQQQLTSLQSHLSVINSSIQQYRRQYDKIESIITVNERQLDHLKTYFKNRVIEDEDNLERENRLSSLLQNELMNAQKIVNFNNGRNEELKIKEIQMVKH